uniref:Uncharacterized protein n=2 Tax=Trichobilharzia regenti TaxID=157069 RepID=A0AA85JNV9_TRIRE|nr:unnamed protein product [Trichobilharzia regenti]
MADILADLQDSFTSNDVCRQHVLIVKIEEWSRIRIDANNAKMINDCLEKVLSIYYSHSFLGCSLCKSNDRMIWTSLLASFLDSKKVLDNSSRLGLKDILLVEFTLSGESIYLIDVLLQMNTAVSTPDFAAAVTKRIFSMDKTIFKSYVNTIRILMLYKWLDLNFPHIVKPTQEQLSRKYLDADSIFRWMRKRIPTKIKLAYWKTCTTNEKIQMLLNAFDLSTLAKLLNPCSDDDVEGKNNDNAGNQVKIQRHKQKEKRKLKAKHRLSAHDGVYSAKCKKGNRAFENMNTPDVDIESIINHELAEEEIYEIHTNSKRELPTDSPELNTKRRKLTGNTNVETINEVPEFLRLDDSPSVMEDSGDNKGEDDTPLEANIPTKINNTISPMGSPDTPRKRKSATPIPDKGEIGSNISSPTTANQRERNMDQTDSLAYISLDGLIGGSGSSLDGKPVVSTTPTRGDETQSRNTPRKRKSATPIPDKGEIGSNISSPTTANQRERNMDQTDSLAYISLDGLIGGSGSSLDGKPVVSTTPTRGDETQSRNTPRKRKSATPIPDKGEIGSNISSPTTANQRERNMDQTDSLAYISLDEGEIGSNISSPTTANQRERNMDQTDSLAYISLDGLIGGSGSSLDGKPVVSTTPTRGDETQSRNTPRKRKSATPIPDKGEIGSNISSPTTANQRERNMDQTDSLAYISLDGLIGGSGSSLDGKPVVSTTPTRGDETQSRNTPRKRKSATPIPDKGEIGSNISSPTTANQRERNMDQTDSLAYISLDGLIGGSGSSLDGKPVVSTTPTRGDETQSRNTPRKRKSATPIPDKGEIGSNISSPTTANQRERNMDQTDSLAYISLDGLIGGSGSSLDGKPVVSTTPTRGDETQSRNTPRKRKSATPIPDKGEIGSNISSPTTANQRERNMDQTDSLAYISLDGLIGGSGSSLDGKPVVSTTPTRGDETQSRNTPRKRKSATPIPDKGEIGSNISSPTTANQRERNMDQTDSLAYISLDGLIGGSGSSLDGKPVVSTTPTRGDETQSRNTPRKRKSATPIPDKGEIGSNISSPTTANQRERNMDQTDSLAYISLDGLIGGSGSSLDGKPVVSTTPTRGDETQSRNTPRKRKSATPIPDKGEIGSNISSPTTANQRERNMDQTDSLAYISLDGLIGGSGSSLDGKPVVSTTPTRGDETQSRNTPRKRKSATPIPDKGEIGSNISSPTTANQRERNMDQTDSLAYISLDGLIGGSGSSLDGKPVVSTTPTRGDETQSRNTPRKRRSATPIPDKGEIGSNISSPTTANQRERNMDQTDSLAYISLDGLIGGSGSSLDGKPVVSTTPTRGDETQSRNTPRKRKSATPIPDKGEIGSNISSPTTANQRERNMDQTDSLAYISLDGLIGGSGSSLDGKPVVSTTPTRGDETQSRNTPRKRKSATPIPDKGEIGSNISSPTTANQRERNMDQTDSLAYISLDGLIGGSGSSLDGKPVVSTTPTRGDETQSRNTPRKRKSATPIPHKGEIGSNISSPTTANQRERNMDQTDSLAYISLDGLIGGSGSSLDGKPVVSTTPTRGDETQSRNIPRKRRSATPIPDKGEIGSNISSPTTANQRERNMDQTDSLAYISLDGLIGGSGSSLDGKPVVSTTPTRGDETQSRNTPRKRKSATPIPDKGEIGSNISSPTTANQRERNMDQTDSLAYISLDGLIGGSGSSLDGKPVVSTTPTRGDETQSRNTPRKRKSATPIPDKGEIGSNISSPTTANQRERNMDQTDSLAYISLDGLIGGSGSSLDGKPVVSTTPTRGDETQSRNTPRKRKSATPIPDKGEIGSNISSPTTANQRERNMDQTDSLAYISLDGLIGGSGSSLDGKPVVSTTPTRGDETQSRNTPRKRKSATPIPDKGEIGSNISSPTTANQRERNMDQTDSLAYISLDGLIGGSGSSLDGKPVVSTTPTRGDETQIRNIPRKRRSATPIPDKGEIGSNISSPTTANQRERNMDQTDSLAYIRLDEGEIGSNISSPTTANQRERNMDQTDSLAYISLDGLIGGSGSSLDGKPVVSTTPTRGDETQSRNTPRKRKSATPIPDKGEIGSNISSPTTANQRERNMVCDAVAMVPVVDIGLNGIALETSGMLVAERKMYVGRMLFRINGEVFTILHVRQQ